MKKEIKDLVEALQLMYEQYCADAGHEFMTAGEQAAVVLQRYGYGFDDAGRMIAVPKDSPLKENN